MRHALMMCASLAERRGEGRGRASRGLPFPVHDGRDVLFAEGVGQDEEQ